LIIFIDLIINNLSYLYLSRDDGMVYFNIIAIPQSTTP